ncbi:MAG: hypothetical protein N3F66_09640 [Spirochaetes bacterium]|nr:hypothetical protein [Spirochaetota bacterium]
MKFAYLLNQIYATLAGYRQRNSYYILLFAFACAMTMALHTHDIYFQCILMHLIQLYHGYRWTTTYIKNYCAPVKQCVIPLELFKPITIIQEKLFIHSQ